jgi:hypothetical protein
MGHDAHMRANMSFGAKLGMLCAVLLLAFAACMAAPNMAFAKGGVLSGSGTSSDPYLIEDAQDLCNISNMSAYYKMTADIDMSSVSFTPIGTSSSAFKGTFDGDGHEIKNLSISASDSSFAAVGLFGYAKGASASSPVVIKTLPYQEK